MRIPFKFTDSDNNLCAACYDENNDHFAVWSLEFPKVIHTFLPDEVEDLLNRGIWKRLN